MSTIEQGTLHYEQAASGYGQHGTGYRQQKSGYRSATIGYEEPTIVPGQLESHEGGSRLQRNKTMIATDVETRPTERKRPRFVDHVGVNLVIMLFFPPWFFVWICLYFFAK